MSANGGDQFKLIRVVTNEARLRASRPADPTFVSRVYAALDAWKTALAPQKIQAEQVLTDAWTAGSRNSEARRIRRHLIQLQDNKKADYTLILGGDRIVPFYRLSDPVEDLTNDRLIYSDDPYVAEDDQLFKPKHPIGRLPHGRGQHDDVLIELLQRSARSHRVQWDAVCRLAFTTQSWRQQSRATWPSASDWYECPPWRLSSPPHDMHPASRVTSALLTDKTFHYYNLHGYKNGDWIGECDCGWLPGAIMGGMPSVTCLLPVLNADEVPILPPAVILSATCFGGFTTRPRLARNLALRFLQQGAMIYIGATGRAYAAGPLDGPRTDLRYSDLLASHLLKSIEDNRGAFPQRRIGELVQAVKTNYHLSRGSYQLQCDKKTLWEFVLYGDPTLIPFCRVASQEKSGDVS